MENVKYQLILNAIFKIFLAVLNLKIAGPFKLQCQHSSGIIAARLYLAWLHFCLKIGAIRGLALSFQNIAVLRNGGFLFRMALLASGGAGVLYVRWKIMGTGPPAFTEVDNPASFADSVLVRVSAKPVPCWIVLSAHQMPAPLCSSSCFPARPQNPSTCLCSREGSSRMKPEFY